MDERTVINLILHILDIKNLPGLTTRREKNSADMDVHIDETPININMTYKSLLFCDYSSFYLFLYWNK